MHHAISASGDLMPTDEDVRAMVAALHKCDGDHSYSDREIANEIVALLAANARLKADSVRLDWLEHQYVVVRKPLRYGSAPLFDACPDEDDNPSSLRTLIDAALSPHNEAGK